MKQLMRAFKLGLLALIALAGIAVAGALATNGHHRHHGGTTTTTTTTTTAAPQVWTSTSSYTACASSDCGGDSITLQWSFPTPGFTPTGYYITSNGTRIADTSSTASSYQVTGMDCATTYTLGVQAHDSSGDVYPSSPATTSYTTPTCPGIVKASGYPVQTIVAANSTTGPYSQSVTIQAVGDLLVVGGTVPNNATVSAADSNSRVTGWTCSNHVDGTISFDFLCWGTTASTGATSIQLTTSPALGATHDVEIDTDEFSSGLGTSTTWTQDGTTGTQDNASSTTVTFPSLTPSHSGELYWGAVGVGNAVTSGSGTSGWTLEGPDLWGGADIWAANSQIVSGIPVQPTAAQSPAGTSSAMAGLFYPSVSGGSIPVNTSAPTASMTTASEGTPQVGQTMTAGTGSWSGSPTGYGYQWQTCSLSGTSCSNATGTGAATATYTLAQADVAHTMRVQVTATNGTGSSSPVQSSALGQLMEVTGGTVSTANTTWTSVFDESAASGLTSDTAGATTNGDTGWGFNKSEVARTSDGTEFAVATSGSGDNKIYVLRKRTGTNTWATVSDGLTDDAGREDPNILVTPTDHVILIVEPFNTPDTGATSGIPNVIDEGVDANGPYVDKGGIPSSGTSCHPSGASCGWNFAGFTGGPAATDHPYAGATIDSNGNMYVMESGPTSNNCPASNYNCANGSGYQADEGGLDELAWQTGCPGSCTWHFEDLPIVNTTNSPGDANAADFRYLYPIMLPDYKGGMDIIETNGVQCDDTDFTTKYGYDSVAYPNGGFVQDTAYDWHTASMNSSAPTWTETLIKRDTTHTAGVGGAHNCANSGIIQNVLASDAYRDTSGKVHVMYQDEGTEQEAILTDGTLNSTTATTSLSCGGSNSRITQDYTGRFYIATDCSGTQFQGSYNMGTDGITIGPETQITPAQTPYGWAFLASPRNGSALTKNMDWMYPYSTTTGIEATRNTLAP